MARYGGGIWIFFTFSDSFLGGGVEKTQEIWIWGGSTSVHSKKGGVQMVAVKNGQGVLGCMQISYTPLPSGWFWQLPLGLKVGSGLEGGRNLLFHEEDFLPKSLLNDTLGRFGVETQQCPYRYPADAVIQYFR